MDRLPFTDVDGLDYDAADNRVVVTSGGSTLVMAIDPAKRDWKWWDIGWNVHIVRPLAGRYIAASMYDGVVMQSKQDLSQQLAAGSK